eukprot:CAMPEP_0115245468 /NCGR_PEP_ID=MMETSP0270-20121206/40527_1 /TAXON_ID=71861 /ORGANISM="Scrippsiella trochoidea, Strain CCMP3099" /LENGTH=81 /DNA_ID=CAMNT_0002660653 /DNA_START=616 /DNA_END=861 /DNA_ORIENTATION=-
MTVASGAPRAEVANVAWWPWHHGGSWRTRAGHAGQDTLLQAIIDAQVLLKRSTAERAATNLTTSQRSLACIQHTGQTMAAE